jgi:branched-chain amino acid transport system permease protein
VTAFWSYLLHGIAVGSSFALVASGLIIIFRVTRVVNLAQGTFAVVATFTTASLLGRGLPHGVAELLAVLVAGILGLLTGAVAVGKRGTRPQASLITTLAVGLLCYALDILVWGDQPRSFSGLSGSFTLSGLEFPKQYAVIIGATLLVFAALEGFLERTYLGKALTACASNPYAATLVGIGVVRMSLLAFMLGGVLGGVSGVLLAPLAPLSYDSDVLLFVNGFASAIFAGLKRPLYALGGGLVLGVAEALVAGYAKASYQSAFALLLTLAILVVQGARRPALQGTED